MSKAVCLVLMVGCVMSASPAGAAFSAVALPRTLSQVVASPISFPVPATSPNPTSVDTDSVVACNPADAVTMDTLSVPTQSGKIITATPVNLQAILNDPATRPGDTIQLTPGLTYSPITLPKKDNADGKWIVIRSAAADQNNEQNRNFPMAGNRVKESQSAFLAQIVTNGTNAAIQTEAGASHYWLIGLEVKPSTPVNSGNGSLIVLGDSRANSVQAQADHIVLDRMYIHGYPNKEWRRGVTLSGSYLAVINSIINEIHTYTYANAQTPRMESQAIGSWNGPGPYQIKNNTLSAGTQEILFGGSTSCSAAMVPSDIEISGNYFYKPLSWRTTAVPHWWVKNHLELKTGRRVLIQGNYFENNWKDPAGDQSGASVLLAPMNQVESGACYSSVTDNAWSEVRDITFKDNTVFNSGEGMAISAEDSRLLSKQTSCVAITNNLFMGAGSGHQLSPDTSPKGWGNGTLFLVVSGDHFGVHGLTITHNTAFQNGPIMVGDAAHNTDPLLQGVKPNTEVVFENNITNWQKDGHNQTGFHGIAGSGAPEGYGDNPQTADRAAFKKYFNPVSFRQNVVLNADKKVAKRYERSGTNSTCDGTVILGCNSFTDTDPGFVNFNEQLFQLGATSAFKGKATEFFLNQNAQDIGVSDWASLSASERAKAGQKDAMPQAGINTVVTPNTAPSVQSSIVPTGSTLTVFKRTLRYGMRGADVREVQKFLNSHGFAVASSGAGAPARETNFFGARTVAAVKKFQAAHVEEGYQAGVLDGSTRVTIEQMMF